MSSEVVGLTELLGIFAEGLLNEKNVGRCDAEIEVVNFAADCRVAGDAEPPDEREQRPACAIGQADARPSALSPPRQDGR